MPSSARGIVFTAPRECPGGLRAPRSRPPAGPPAPHPHPWSAPGRRSPASWGPRLRGLCPPAPTAPRWPVRPGSAWAWWKRWGGGDRAGPGRPYPHRGPARQPRPAGHRPRGAAGPPGTRRIPSVARTSPCPSRRAWATKPPPSPCWAPSPCTASTGGLSAGGELRRGGPGRGGALLVQLARAPGARPVVGIDLVPRAWSGPGAAGPTLRLTPPDSTPGGGARRPLPHRGPGADVGFEATRTPPPFRLMRIAALGAGGGGGEYPRHGRATLVRRPAAQGADPDRGLAAPGPDHPPALRPLDAESDGPSSWSWWSRDCRRGHLVTHRARPEEAPRPLRRDGAGAGLDGVEFVWDATTGPGPRACAGEGGRATPGAAPATARRPLGDGRLLVGDDEGAARGRSRCSWSGATARR